MTICLECGKKVDKKNKSVMGMWSDTCEMCKKENVWCADAGHDFGHYSSREEEIFDKTIGRL